MKVENLQINDWVKLGARYVQVTELLYDGRINTTKGESCSAHTISPIPMTVGVLINNGLTVKYIKKFTTLYVTADEQITVALDGAMWFVSIYEANDVVGSGYITCVHELQHLLNLWKPNFKIELTKKLN